MRRGEKVESFERIIMIGSTRLIYRCADIVKKNYPQNEIEIIDLNQDSINDRYKEKYNHRYLAKKELMEFLRDVQEKILIFSVMNYYIIPEDLVAKENLTCINLHHAFLPNHPGRNPEAWAIWEEDAKSGITWHFISSGVDTGDIIAQEEIAIGENETSLSLFQKENATAVKILDSILPLKLNKVVGGIKQNTEERGKLRYSYEAPNNGCLDLNWDGKTIYRFLRSMNYGTPNFFMYMKVNWCGIEYKFFNYRKVDCAEGIQDVSFNSEDRILTIIKNGVEIKLYGLEQINE